MRQLFVNATLKNVSLLIEDVTSNSSLTLAGVNVDKFHENPTWTQYQPVVAANRTYRLTWDSHSTPDSVDLDLCVCNLPQ